MQDDAPGDEFLTRVAAYIDAQDVRELRGLWGDAGFADVATYVWTHVPSIVRRLVKLVEWGVDLDA
jgi:hypothetical protein